MENNNRWMLKIRIKNAAVWLLSNYLRGINRLFVDRLELNRINKNFRFISKAKLRSRKLSSS